MTTPCSIVTSVRKQVRRKETGGFWPLPVLDPSLNHVLSTQVLSTMPLFSYVQPCNSYTNHQANYTCTWEWQSSQYKTKYLVTDQRLEVKVESCFHIEVRYSGLVLPKPIIHNHCQEWRELLSWHPPHCPRGLFVNWGGNGFTWHSHAAALNTHQSCCVSLWQANCS